MANSDLWTMFEKTGSVLDYLSYKGIHTDQKEQMKSREVGERSFESDGNCDRNGTVRDAYWRI